MHQPNIQDIKEMEHVLHKTNTCAHRFYYRMRLKIVSETKFKLCPHLNLETQWNSISFITTLNYVCSYILVNIEPHSLDFDCYRGYHLLPSLFVLT